MKRILVLAMALVMALSVSGCARKAQREALLQYMNYDTVQMDIKSDQMIDSFNSVVSDNQFNNAVTLKEFKDKTRGLAEDALEEAIIVRELIEDEDIAEIHEKYIVYLEEYIKLIDMAIMGIEETSPDIVNQVNSRLNELNEMLVEYYDALKDFGKECGVEVSVDYVK